MQVRPRKRTVVMAAMAGTLAVGAPAAYAADDILSDNGSSNDVSVPVNVCGNNVNVIAGLVENDAKAECTNNVDQSGDRSSDGGDSGDTVFSTNLSNNDGAGPGNGCGNNGTGGLAVENDTTAKCHNNVDQG